MENEGLKMPYNMATNIRGTTNCDKHKSSKVAYVAAYI